MAKTNYVDGNPATGERGSVPGGDFFRHANHHLHTGVDEDGHGAKPYTVAGGTADALVLEYPAHLPGNTEGVVLWFKAGATNTGAVTVQVRAYASIPDDGSPPATADLAGGARPLKLKTTQALRAGDLISGSVYAITYTNEGYYVLLLESVPPLSHVEARRGSNQGIANAAWAGVIFDAEGFDYLGEYDNATGVFTPLYKGLYLITASCVFTTEGTGQRQMRLMRAGGDDNLRDNRDASSLQPTTLNFAKPVALEAGQTLKIEVYQDSGAPLDLLITKTQLSIARIDVY